MRYHSLTVDPNGLPSCLRITATTSDGVVMGLAHRELPMFGVQFHPESIASEYGHAILANFLELAGIPRITSYNVCYTKLLRDLQLLENPVAVGVHRLRRQAQLVGDRLHLLAVGDHQGNLDFPLGQQIERRTAAVRLVV